MATNVEEKFDANVEIEGMGTAPPTDGQNHSSDTGNDQIGSISCTTRLVNLGRLLLHLVCSGYNFYLIWLLVYLEDNNNYWFLSLIPICSYYLPYLSQLVWTANFPELQPSYGVVLSLMTCFTILTRQVYYHRQPDEFIGPRFIILSLQASIILILLDFVLQRIGHLESLLDYKDVLTRMLLDFVDIFNMVEILSVNVCVGVGSYVSENSSTERAIQAFCTMSFVIVLYRPKSIFMTLNDEIFLGLTEEQHSSGTYGEILYSGITMCSGLYQNLPFLVIRIVVWVQYNLYNLGYLVKNVIVIVLFFLQRYINMDQKLHLL